MSPRALALVRPATPAHLPIAALVVLVTVSALLGATGVAPAAALLPIAMALVLGVALGPRLRGFRVPGAR